MKNKIVITDIIERTITKKRRGNLILFLRQGLQLHEFVVVAMECKKLVMSSRFTNPTLLDEVSIDDVSIGTTRESSPPRSLHAVSVLDGGQSVGNSDGGATTSGLVQCILNNFLRVGV